MREGFSSSPRSTLQGHFPQKILEANTATKLRPRQIAGQRHVRPSATLNNQKLARNPKQGNEGQTHCEVSGVVRPEREVHGPGNTQPRAEQPEKKPEDQLRPTQTIPFADKGFTEKMGQKIFNHSGDIGRILILFSL